VEVDSVSAVQQAVQDSVSEGRLAEGPVPQGDG